MGIWSVSLGRALLDSHHRRQLRQTNGFHYPQIINTKAGDSAGRSAGWSDEPGGDSSAICYICYRTSTYFNPDRDGFRGRPPGTTRHLNEDLLATESALDPIWSDCRCISLGNAACQYTQHGCSCSPKLPIRGGCRIYVIIDNVLRKQTSWVDLALRIANQTVHPQSFSSTERTTRPIIFDIEAYSRKEGGELSQRV
ncbi:hypothetical protein LSAT2_000598 [Lamellibrachia satsuma]|nr:hypothetical protein LSAT2_000598 [Lamellibrachia satsuma]